MLLKTFMYFVGIKSLFPIQALYQEYYKAYTCTMLCKVLHVLLIKLHVMVALKHCNIICRHMYTPVQTNCKQNCKILYFDCSGCLYILYCLEVISLIQEIGG